jgi:hypothetical protein
MLFCDHNTIKHIFFYCHHGKIIWRVVSISIGLTPPKSVSHILGNWLRGITKKDRRLSCGQFGIRVDLVFEKKRFSSFMQAVFMGAYWLRHWSLLQLTT